MKRPLLVGLTAAALLAAAGGLETPAEAKARSRANEPYKHGIKAKTTQKKRRKAKNLKKGKARL